jgi:glycosyltransferase involved in cell wall biosynthesis
MKILFFIDTLRAGGLERRLIELLKGLSKNNSISFEILLMNSDIHYKEIYNICNVYIVKRQKGFDFQALVKVISLYRKIKPDIIHSWSGITSYYAIPLKLLFNARIIGSYISGGRNSRYKQLYPFTDVILANSQAGLKANLAPIKKSQVIYNGFDFARLTYLLDKESLITELEIPPNYYIVGMVASFSTFKDYNNYINSALEILKQKSNVIFLCIGDGDETLYKQKASQHISNFRFLGKRHDVESLINIMDVCVLSTFTEGLSNAVLEYMALQKPVVSSGEGGLSEIIENNKSGYLLPIGEYELMAEKILELLNNKELRIEMGKYGRKIVEGKFPIDKMINEYIQVYEKFQKKK